MEARSTLSALSEVCITFFSSCSAATRPLNRFTSACSPALSSSTCAMRKLMFALMATSSAEASFSFIHWRSSFVSSDESSSRPSCVYAASCSSADELVPPPPPPSSSSSSSRWAGRRRRSRICSCFSASCCLTKASCVLASCSLSVAASRCAAERLCIRACSACTCARAALSSRSKMRPLEAVVAESASAAAAARFAAAASSRSCCICSRAVAESWSTRTEFHCFCRNLTSRRRSRICEAALASVSPEVPAASTASRDGIDAETSASDCCAWPASNALLAARSCLSCDASERRSVASRSFSSRSSLHVCCSAARSSRYWSTCCKSSFFCWSLGAPVDRGGGGRSTAAGLLSEALAGTAVRTRSMTESRSVRSMSMSSSRAARSSAR